MYVKKFASFCQVLKKTHKRKLVHFLCHHEAEKRNHFSFMNKSFNMQCNLQNLVLLLLVNIIIDVTYLISGI